MVSFFMADWFEGGWHFHLASFVNSNFVVKIFGVSRHMDQWDFDLLSIHYEVND